MELPIGVDYAPMEADTGAEIPSGHGRYYEPKWDGFRCLAFRDGDEVDLRSKAGKPLGRSFGELHLRLHPAASRVRKLAAAPPAVFVAFDLLLGPRGGPLAERPLEER